MDFLPATLLWSQQFIRWVYCYFLAKGQITQPTDIRQVVVNHNHPSTNNIKNQDRYRRPVKSSTNVFGDRWLLRWVWITEHVISTTRTCTYMFLAAGTVTCLDISVWPLCAKLSACFSFVRVICRFPVRTYNFLKGYQLISDATMPWSKRATSL